MFNPVLELTLTGFELANLLGCLLQNNVGYVEANCVLLYVQDALFFHSRILNCAEMLLYGQQRDWIYVKTPDV